MGTGFLLGEVIKMFRKLDCSDGCLTANISKTTESYTLNRWTVCEHISIKPLKNKGGGHLEAPAFTVPGALNLVTILVGHMVRGRGARPPQRRTRNPTTKNVEPHSPNPSQLGHPGWGGKQVPFPISCHQNYNYMDVLSHLYWGHLLSRTSWNTVATEISNDT